MFKILVVEDDCKLNEVYCSFLNKNGYNTVGCYDVNKAYDVFVSDVFDLIISDIMMPGIDGYSFATAVRNINLEIPILFVTARDDFLSKQKSFKMGVDDYMVKPIDLNELILRVGPLLRRAKIASSKQITVGSFTMNADEYSVSVDGKQIEFTVREFNILYKLLSYPKKAFTRSQLMDEFWDSETLSSPRTVDVYITKIREKTAFCKEFEIVTVHGLGYKAVLK